MKIITTKLHTYGLIYKISESLYLMLSLFSILAGLFFLYAFINSLIAGNKIDINSILIALVYSLVSVTWSLIFFLFFAYLFSGIEIHSDGMKIRFLLKRYLIKWDEIIDITPSRPFGLFTNKNIKVVIVKNNLTFIHRLYGLFYTGRYTPAILIYRKISEYDLLMDNISTQVKKISVESVSN
jgi:hypothetical protein